MSNPGMRIKRSFTRPDRSIIDLFKDVPAANIADVTSRLFATDARLSPMGRAKKLLGPALTVKSSMADNFIFHKALSLAQPGDVIVVNACGDTNHSVCGDVMYRYAMSRGVAGFVVDGCVRDLDFLQEHDFPVYAIGATPRGPYKNPVGEINFDIACGGQVVHPGDIIAGDADGIAVIRQDDALDISAKLAAVLEKETLMGRLIEEGRWEEESPLLTMVNREIERLGFEILD
ncbi:MAG: RraA family protein [Synergistaceae bacterium]|nr:RraA family protein [Synergistaceae bacterium]